MNDYQALRIDATPCNSDITDLLAAYLADAGYESFVPDEKGLLAYIPVAAFDRAAVNAILADFPIPAQFIVNSEVIEGKDWNEEWEKNYFKPIVVVDRCVIHSTFHRDYPKADYEIVIDPRMAFGTGHHSTTSLMIRGILDMDLEGKSVIDMGTGTGILAILAAMRGAKATGIEIDPAAWENAKDNARLNNSDVELICGDASSLRSLGEADVFLANINRNIILADMQEYVEHLKSGGTALFSGFYSADIPLVEAMAEELGMEKVAERRADDDWVAVSFIKK